MSRVPVRCDDICAYHPDAPGLCLGSELGGEQDVVRIIGGRLIPHDVQMCRPCGDWWRTNRPERVAGGESA